MNILYHQNQSKISNFVPNGIFNIKFSESQKVCNPFPSFSSGILKKQVNVMFGIFLLMLKSKFSQLESGLTIKLDLALIVMPLNFNSAPHVTLLLLFC